MNIKAAKVDLWNPSSYEIANSANYRDASGLIEKMLEDKITSADIIVDFGCGSGDVTELLGKTIKHKKIYAYDFSPQMIEYASKSHNTDGNIEYFVQDLGLPWNQLDDQLKKLEGKVSLIFSNRAIHWIPNRAEVVKTIERLLKPGGHCYIQATLRRDLLEFATIEEKQEFQHLIKSETQEEQKQMWKKHFKNAGLSTVSIQLLETEWRFDTEEEYYDQFRGIEYYLNIIMRENLPKEIQKKLVEKFSPWIVKQLHTKNGLNFQTHADPDVRHIYNDMFRIIVKKVTNRRKSQKYWRYLPFF